jgi:hypothetical protein
MRCTAFCLVAAWAAASAAASANIDVAGQSEFHGGVLLPRQQGRVNLQAFTGALGGAKAPAITNSGDPQRPFEVDGDTFVRSTQLAEATSSRKAALPDGGGVAWLTGSMFDIRPDGFRVGVQPRL